MSFFLPLTPPTVFPQTHTYFTQLQETPS